MSGYTNLPTFSPADYADNDTYGEDCTAEMLARQTTISTVTLASIVRSDGRALITGDMQVSNISVFAGGSKYAWKGTGGVPGIIYYIRFRLTLASGDIINRTVVVPVPPFVG